MDRSFAARSPIGRLGRSQQARQRAGESRGFAPVERLRSGFAGALGMLSAHRRVRLTLTCLVVALPLLGGGWMWFRHSSFVSVEQVRVSGAHGPQSAAIDAALVEAAHGMSTVAPSDSVLRAAVARFPQVSEVRAVPSFPHGMRILVVEQAPAAALVVSGLRTAVSADGVVLGPALASSSLPVVGGGFVPPIGAHLNNPLLIEAMAVLGAAPHALNGLIARAYIGPRGLTVAMHNGLLVFFGDAGRPHAKWLSLLSVLADPGSAGASYIDVRLPGRPAAGFGSTATPEVQTGTAAAGKGTSESTVSALAAGLKSANPEPSPPAGESESSSSGEAAPSTSESEQPGSSSTGTESPETGTGTQGG
jgi:cell division protein FtsQ